MLKVLRNSRFELVSWRGGSKIPRLPAGQNRLYLGAWSFRRRGRSIYANRKIRLYYSRSARALQSADLCPRTGTFPGRALAGLESRAIRHLVRQAALEKGNQWR